MLWYPHSFWNWRSPSGLDILFRIFAATRQDFDSEANMSGFWQDFRYAARVLGKNPGVTTIMVFTLALAMGATTAIFSVVYGVLLRPLPYSGADRIMALSEVNSNGRPARLADPNFDDFRDQSHSFQSIAKYAAG